MTRVKYEDFLPTRMEEYLNFDKDMPYVIQAKHFEERDTVAEHFGKTLEILVPEDISGIITINHKVYDIQGKEAYIIPPNIIHSNDIFPCAGHLYVFKLDFEILGEYVKLQEILDNEKSDFKISKVPFIYDGEDYQSIKEIVKDLLKYDDDFLYCISLILRLLSILKRKYQQPAEDDIAVTPSKNLEIKQLVEWIQNNLDKKITVDMAAQISGYSKYYFCSIFKEKTGFTFNDFLTNVRMQHACILLQTGLSVREVSVLCGFDNVSYFSQLFKKKNGITPREYVPMTRRQSESTTPGQSPRP